MSDRLTLDQCERLIAAARFAEVIGLPFNRHWTIHYQRAGIAAKDGRRFIGRVLKLAGDTAKRSGRPFAALYSRENGESKGEHVHILMHFPADIRLTNKTRSWVTSAGGRYIARVSRMRTIGGSLRRVDATSEHFQVNADNVLAYLLKAADEETGAALDLRTWGEFGWVIGKRCGGTENIGGAAQRRWASR
jgi:hypothetical protein